MWPWLLPADTLSWLSRITLMLAAGWLVLLVVPRSRPGASIMIQRLMLIAVWIGTGLIFVGPAYRLPVLPPATTRPAAVVAVEQERLPNDSMLAFDGVVPPTRSNTQVQTGSTQPSDQVRSSLRAAVDGGVEPSDRSPVAPATEGAVTNQHQEPSQHAFTTTALTVTNTGSPYLVLAGLWICTSTILIGRTALQTIRAWSIVRRSRRCDPCHLSVAEDVARMLELNRLPEIRTSHEITGPCTIGPWRSIVLVPTGWFHSLSSVQQRMVLAHELSHAMGRDALWDWFARHSRAVFWFHPLVVGLVRYHRLACEHRCDDWAGRAAGDPKLYRRQLARWALEMRGRLNNRIESLAMAERSLMVQRLRWLERSGGSSPPSRVITFLSITTTAIVCVVIATVQPVQRVIAQHPLQREQATENGLKQQQSDEQRLFAPIVWGQTELDVDLAQAVDFAVRVVDPENQPVENARVILGTIEDSNGLSASLPMTQGYASDAKGVAKVKIPAGTARVGLTTVAAGFARHRQNFTTDGAPEIQLLRGRAIHVRAIDPEGRVLENAFPRLAKSRVLGREFNKQADGTHISPIVSLDRRWLQVVASVDDQPLWFSGLVDVANDSLVDDLGVIELAMKPGVLLEGRVDDSVPRPIENGFVELMIVQGEDYQITGDGLRWQDTASIEPDGTFVFPSVPPGGHAQLFALGEGFQSQNPSEAELRDYLHQHQAGSQELIDNALRRPKLWPQLVRLDRPHVEVTLPCRETAALDVRVINTLGEPMVAATGSINPNGYFLPGELFIPGTEISTATMVSRDSGLSALMGAGGEHARFAKSSFLNVAADSDGVIHFRNLPTRRESYEIEADRYVMAARPTSSASNPERYAVVELKDGELARRTITMERDVPRAMRELTVVYHDGEPLADVEATLTEISTSLRDNRWQPWSVQRLGPVSRSRTNAEGRVVLSYPIQLEGQSVERLRLHLRGRPELDVSLRSDVTVPVAPDRRMIRIMPGEPQPDPNVLRRASVQYAPWPAADLSTAEMVKRLVNKPTLVGLQQLLQENGFSDASPVELLPDRNRITVQPGEAIVRLMTSDVERIVCLAHVRPRGATWTDRDPRGGSPPEAAFIFDGAGQLVRMIGGGTSASGSRESITLINLGGTGDYFVRTSAFEPHLPFKMRSRWQRIGSSDTAALTIDHYANSNSWSGINGTSEPVSEFGFLGFEFNGQDIDHRLPGLTPEGCQVPRKILWDGRADTFCGPVTQSFDGRPLYRVVESESSEFQALPTTAEQIVVAGGRRDFRNWHQWTVTIPRSGAYVARLLIRATDGSTLRSLAEAELAAGQHNFQLQIAPEEQTETQSKLSWMLDAQDASERKTLNIARMEIDERPSVSGQGVYFTGRSAVRLLEKQLTNESQTLVWIIDKQGP